MPQSTPERRARWTAEDGSVTERTAVLFLEEAGFILTRRWNWILPSPNHETTEQEVDAVLFLIEEFDFGGTYATAEKEATSSAPPDPAPPDPRSLPMVAALDADVSGHRAQPVRYTDTENNRETIDHIRDVLGDRGFRDFCHGTALKYNRSKPQIEGAEELLQAVLAALDGKATLYGPPIEPLIEDIRAALDNAEAYGRVVDQAKQNWYQQMIDHLDGRHARVNPPNLRAVDPREARGDAFVPYKRARLPEPLPERRINVLDHGYVRFIESYGQGDVRMNEAGIIEAARQSTQGSFRGWKTDARLLKYLYENKHSTPFEFAGLILEVQAPIFVFRQWHRHRTQSYNEASARYEKLPDLWYVPTIERLLADGGANKQAGTAGGAQVLTEARAREVQKQLHGVCAEFAATYTKQLLEGVPKELARLGMPVNWYSRMRVHANLRNWLAFQTLRLDPHAQWEVRQFAEAVQVLIREEFPETAVLFDETLGWAA